MLFCLFVCLCVYVAGELLGSEGDSDHSDAEDPSRNPQSLHQDCEGDFYTYLHTLTHTHTTEIYFLFGASTVNCQGEKCRAI